MSDTGKNPNSSILGIENAAALLAAIVASSTDAILSKNLDGIITSWNDSTEKLFGYNAAEMVGQSIRRIIPDDRQQEEDYILAKIAAGERIENYETVRVRKDGRPIEVSVTISPVRTPDGSIVGASKIVRDITERKQSEEQIQALLKEVNHRAKNTLAVVQAIARQTVPEGQQKFLDSFLERIQALSTNQDLLVANAWRGVTMEELARTQLAPFEGLGGRMAISGPALQLTSAAAQTIGMVLHELATNAVKHGALSSGDGNVSVAWRRDSGEFFIEWVERGGPAITGPPEQTGYGTVVVATMPKLNLGADIDVLYDAVGFGWRLRCPAQRALGDADAYRRDPA